MALSTTQKRQLITGLLFLGTAAIVGTQIGVLTAKRHVPLDELNCIRDSFDHNFKVDIGTSNTPNLVSIPMSDQHIIDAGIFRQFIEDQACTRGSKALVVHPGLVKNSDDNWTYIPGFSKTCTTGSNDEYRINHNDNVYVIDNNTFVRSGTLAEWNGNAAPGGLYAANVLIKRSYPNGNHTKFVIDHDVKHVIHPLRAINKVIDQNNLINNPGSISTIATAEPEVRNVDGNGNVIYEGSIHQRFCFVGVRNGVELLNNSTNTLKNYKMKGADLGSPCPDNCVEAKFQKSGIKPAERCPY